MKPQIRKFTEDYKRDEIKKISKGEYIELLELKTKNKSIEATFNILDEKQNKIDKVTAGFTTSTWKKFWNCTKEVGEK